MRTPVVVLASLLLVAGCSTSEAGEPKATGEPVATTAQPTETSGTSETSPAPTEGPRRPRDLDLGAADICAVLRSLPLRKYGLDGRPPVAGTSRIFPGNKDCFAGGIGKNLSLTLIAVTDQGAGDVVSTANAQVTDFDAQGYPLSVLKPEQPANCFGVLDVHDGQFVWIAYGLGSPAERPVTPQEQLCNTVPMIAASAVAALG